MKKVFRKNQIIITALALMIAAAGYFNYAEKNLLKSTSTGKEKETVRDKEADAGVDDPYKDDSLLTSDEDILSMESDVSSEATSEAATDAQKASTEGETVSESADTENKETSEPGEAVLTSGSTFSSGAKLNREQLRAKNKASLLEVINNASLTQEQKQNAVDAMVKMTENSETEEEIEMLLEAKGFGDAVVSISDKSVDIVMKMEGITDAKRAQIEDIVERKTDVKAENIVLTPLN